jgi:hypothetical protein
MRNTCPISGYHVVGSCWRKKRRQNDQYIGGTTALVGALNFFRIGGWKLVNI